MFSPPVDLDEWDAAAEPFLIPDDDGDCDGLDLTEAHWDDGDAGSWADRARAVDAAMAVAVGEAAWTVGVLADCGKAASMIAWCEYREVGVMHAHLTATGKPVGSARGVKMLDIETQAAARIAMAQGLTQRCAEQWLAEAVVMRDRLPAVGRCLRDGLVSPRRFRLIAARTDLIDDTDWAPALDAELAAVLRRRRGTWSNRRLTDMVDRLIFRHDPDAVRRRHTKAKQGRSVWVLPDADGMATLGASMTAQDAKIALDAVARLAALVCDQDPRTVDARRCDAMFALLTGTAFDCDCGHDTCPADLPDPTIISALARTTQNQAIAAGAVLVHVIATQSSIDGHDKNPAFLDGHGVISAAHLHDLLARDDTRIRPLHPNNPDPANTTSTHDGEAADIGDLPASLPTHLPSDAYRPSTALDTFIRARDGYCTIAGCDQPAWRCDIDHVTEYDHDNPEQGGHTHPDGLALKCRLHHRLKTFGHGWIDDQYRDPNGRLRCETTSPEHIRYPGPAETNQDLFPALNTLTWHDPPPPTATRPTTTTPRPPDRPAGSRLKAKHARRRQERQVNREQRLAEEAESAKREEQRRHDHPRPTDGDPPF